jgi:precorrin-2/cobalt-factor-2 C20-methyltransferase
MSLKKSLKQSLQKGRFIGVGVGPGDPELMTVKAWRALQSAPVISFLVNEQGRSQSKEIAQPALESVSEKALEIPISMPMLTERKAANAAYDLGASEIQAHLNNGLDVLFLCEGDPLFYGSFTYLLDRLSSEFTCEVIPGITSVNAASATLVHPLTMLKESFAVMNGRHSDEQIINALKQHDSVVIMKAGQARPRLLALLEQSGRIHEAQYLEYIGRENQRIVQDVTTLEAEAGPYFSLFVVTSSQRGHRESR